MKKLLANHFLNNEASSSTKVMVMMSVYEDRGVGRSCLGKLKKKKEHEKEIQVGWPGTIECPSDLSTSHDGGIFV